MKGEQLIKEAKIAPLTESTRTRLTVILESIRNKELAVDNFEQLDNLEIEEDPDYIDEKWSNKYKRSIDCSHPKGFSQRAHCQGRKK